MAINRKRGQGSSCTVAPAEEEIKNKIAVAAVYWMVKP
jgi:hypothetical protein